MTSYHKARVAHVIMIPFSGVGIDTFRDDYWLEYRIEIFKQYTLKSLQNQSNTKFMLWLTFRPEDKHSWALQGLWEALKEVHIPYISTFGGLMYYDDKFAPGLKNLAKNALRVVRGCYRTKQWDILIPSLTGLLRNKNQTLPQRLDHSLESLQKNLHNIDWIYLTRLDSDDMLHREAVADIQGVAPEYKLAITMKRGYITDTHHIAEYIPTTNPPFHTIVFPGRVFLDSLSHWQYYGDFQSHEDIPRLFTTKSIPNGRYCVVTHDLRQQISTVFFHPFRGKLVGQGVLKDFGITSE